MPKTKTNKSDTIKRAKEIKRSSGKALATKHGGGAGAVTIERRAAASKDRRTQGERRKKGAPVAVERRKMERRVKVNRRRQIDPTTCERDYSAEELEFMTAMDEYKRTSGRMFPTCSEVLEVIRSLGYEKPSRAAAAQTLHALLDQTGPTSASEAAAV